MKKSNVLIVILFLSLFIFSGCTKQEAPKSVNSPATAKVINGPSNDQNNIAVKSDIMTYENSEYGYAIDYPKSEMSLTTDILEGGTRDNPGLILKGGHLSLGVYDNPNKLSVREWLDAEYTAYSGGWRGIYQDDQVGSVKVVKAILDERKEDNSGCYIEYAIFEKADKFYTIRGELCDFPKNSLTLFHNVISSFRFIDKSVNTDNVNLEIKNDLLVYKNDKYGFSLEFPKAWEGFTAVEEPFIAWDNKTFSITDLNKSNYPDNGKWNSKISSRLIVLSFHLKGDSERLFSIGVYTKEQWSELNRLISGVNNDPLQSVPHVIGQNDKNIFGLTYIDYSGPHINIKDSTDRLNEINPKILSTFKIVK